MCYQVRFITRTVKCMVTMRLVMAWLGNGFGCSMKDERTCTMKHEVDVHHWWMLIWCVTTDVSQFLICPCTFLIFQGLYSMTLSVVIWVIGKCVHDGCPRCSQRSTKNNTDSRSHHLHLSGNKWTSPRTALIWRQVVFTLPTPKEVPGKQAIWRRRWPEGCGAEVANIAAGRILGGGYTKTCASIMAANMWRNSLKNVESDNNKILYETFLDFFYSETVLTFWISLVLLDV